MGSKSSSIAEGHSSRNTTIMLLRNYLNIQFRFQVEERILENIINIFVYTLFLIFFKYSEFGQQKKCVVIKRRSPTYPQSFRIFWISLVSFLKQKIYFRKISDFFYL